VRASQLTVEATGIDPVRNDLGVKPIAILEVSFAGGANPPPPDGPVGTTCRKDLVTLDGRSVPVRIDATRGEALLGASLPFVSCDETVVPSGPHSVDTEHGVDSLLLSAGQVPNLPTRVDSAPAASVRRLSPAHVRVHVTTDGPAVLTSGESFDAGWEATVGGRRLAAAASLDTQSGWRLSRAGTYTVDLRYRPQRTYGSALLVTLGGLALCSAILVRRPRRG
jgi:arabinofuranan 3-O-arabinosyltransferase